MNFEFIPRLYYYPFFILIKSLNDYLQDNKMSLWPRVKFCDLIKSPCNDVSKLFLNT